MKASGVVRIIALGLGLATALGCDHQSDVPVVASEMHPAPSGSGLPFDREAQPDGISPSSSVIPPGAHLPAGTPVTIRLKSTVSSATAISKDTFEAVLDEPILVDGEIVAPRGTLITGRVVEAKPVVRMQSPGYLRLALSSIAIHGKPVPLRTSSNFLKGAGPGRKPTKLAMASDEALLGAVATQKPSILNNAMVTQSPTPIPVAPAPRDITLGPERRLTFRLIEPFPLRP